MDKKGYRHMNLSVKCMIFYDGKILLLQKNNKTGKCPWEFPGGGLEFGEDFAQAAIREVKEETGLDIDIVDMMGLWSYQRSSTQFLTGIIFSAISKGKEVCLSKEHLDFAWVEPKQITQYPLQPSLYKALKNIKPRTAKANELWSLFCEVFR